MKFTYCFSFFNLRPTSYCKLVLCLLDRKLTDCMVNKEPDSIEAGR